ncbi:MAG TPA: hypothetical protein VMR21_11340 [Vicinamibacteria bacterium]|nr:hypothetical protein [Vicinamibacteria bacterium]
MRDTRRRLHLGLILVAAALASCGGDTAPADGSPSPSASLRPLTPGGASPPAGTDAGTAPGMGAMLPSGHPPVDGAPAATAASEAESVTGTITVAPSLASRATGEALFIIARAGADRQIVAVRRAEVTSFPVTFRISAADAMTAGTSFSGPLEITARLSKTGDAVASKGDLAGVARDVKVGARDVTVVLDTVHQ